MCLIPLKPNPTMLPRVASESQYSCLGLLSSVMTGISQQSCLQLMSALQRVFVFEYRCILKQVSTECSALDKTPALAPPQQRRRKESSWRGEDGAGCREVMSSRHDMASVCTNTHSTCRHLRKTCARSSPSSWEHGLGRGWRKPPSQLRGTVCHWLQRRGSAFFQGVNHYEVGHGPVNNSKPMYMPAALIRPSVCPG